MKLSVSNGINDQKDLPGLRRLVQIMASELETMINGNLTFQDNFKEQTISVLFTAANADQQIPHKLQTVPIGYLVIGKDSIFDVYNGSADVFTKTFVTLRASNTGIANIMIF